MAHQNAGSGSGLKEMNLACWGIFTALLVTRFFYPLWIQFNTGVGSFHIRPADFIYFYGIGRIAHEYPLVRLYDYNLQLKTFNEIYPLHDGAYGPSPYPPFVALFFSLFARVPFLPAFFLWAGTSLALYITGIAAIVKDIFPGERLKVSLIFCFALAFSPFLYSTLANGQIGALAVCSVGFAFALERRSKPFASGMALSILAYKPTLLLLLIPMLLLTRRFRAFSGFTIGAAMLILTATACGGMQIWPAYAHFLSYFGRVAGFDGHSVLRLWKYVDFSSFLQAVCGGRSSVELGILIAATSGIAAGARGVVVEVRQMRHARAIHGMGGDSDLDFAFECLCSGLRLYSGYHLRGADPESYERDGVENGHAMDNFYVGISMFGFMVDRCDRATPRNSGSHHLARRSRIGTALSFAPGDWLGSAANGHRGSLWVGQSWGPPVLLVVG